MPGPAVLPIVALISNLTLEGFKLWQAWCGQNPNATNEEALAFLKQTGDSADATYAKSVDKANALREKLGEGESTL